MSNQIKIDQANGHSSVGFPESRIEHNCGKSQEYMRMPFEWIEFMANNPDKEVFEFVSQGGNILTAQKIKLDNGNTSIEFLYNKDCW